MASKTLRNKRLEKMDAQGGACWYCGFPMWAADPAEIASGHGLTLKQAELLQCTAEHLKARCDGGSDEAANIVAACRTCNRRRHARKRPLAPAAYRSFVRARVASNRWFPFAPQIARP